MVAVGLPPGAVSLTIMSPPHVCWGFQVMFWTRTLTRLPLSPDTVNGRFTPAGLLSGTGAGNDPGSGVHTVGGHVGVAVGVAVEVGVGVTVGVTVTVAVAVGVGVGVGGGGVDVGVAVAVGVTLGVAVAVGVGVGVTPPQPAINARPGVSPPVLHSNCVNRLPVSRCTPTVALAPPPATSPYTISK